ncbi:MAG TPA: 3-phosphoshikimate 1-carboxyvinyltransferase [Acidimicrobiia bacterium]|nr:3-phosphoshikimate 1-carboxyvinyltransferase [Acidimicrobiia bacterium]
MLAVSPLGRPVQGTVRPPGSKSITNRALVAAALADPGASRIHDPLLADDTVAMRNALRAFGVVIDDVDDPWLVLGTGGALDVPAGVVDAGASGTTARFVTAVAALAGGESVIDGTERMRHRPIGPLVDALGMLGVRATARGGFPPVTVTGGTLEGGKTVVDSRSSSQFASALLLVAPMADGEVELELMGPVVSRPYLAGTVQVMRAFGAAVSVEGDRYTVAPAGYRKTNFDVEADASAAVYPAVAAAITGGSVVIQGIPDTSIQPDLEVLHILEKMGCIVSRRDGEIEVTGPPGRLQAIDEDLSGAPDGAMAVAVAALFADSPSRLRGLSTLRLKETDRLAALETELGRVGGEARVDGEILEVGPGRLRPAEVETYDDHRMAMAMALVGLVEPGIVILDPGTVSKTWPGYFEMLSAL